ncbi:MAG TPA: hypothetical protein VIZ87_05340 [Terrimicrobium sp.]
MPKVVVGVVFARWHNASAGHICSIMHWALGLRELGCEVWIVDAISSAELSPPAAAGLASPQEEFWRALVQEFDFHGRECLLIDEQSASLESFREFASAADLFVNYSGQFKALDLFGRRTVKAYLDVDPAFTQLWVEVFKSDMNLDGHDVFLTVGTAMNSPEALVPKLEREWISVLPPVVASFWRQKLGTFPDDSRGSAWTTVAHWYGYNEMEWNGRRYAGKRESLMSMRLLPQHLEKPCVIATDLPPGCDDYIAFREAGWQIIRASEVCKSVSSYLRFIAQSRGEIGIAKEGYVVSRAGWMSDRSVVYLALGRPVVFQDTGWTEAMAPGPGMLLFHDVEDCARAISSIENEYDTHARAAQALADVTFSPQQVLRPLLEKIL